MAANEEVYEKITVRLYRGDKDKMCNLFPGVAFNKIIRELVRDYIDKAEKLT